MFDQELGGRQGKELWDEFCANVLRHRVRLLSAMSALGLGCVKTRWRGDPIEWTFFQFAIWLATILERGRL